MAMAPRPFAVLASFLLLSSVVLAQRPAAAPAALTAADYARAERFMSYSTAALVLHSGVRPTWTTSDRFWYRTTSETGPEAWLVDAASATKAVCTLDPCKTAGPAIGASTARNGVASPDGTHTAFIRDWNLWVRETGTNNEVQLTKDDVSAFGYATDNAGWRRSDRPI